MSRIRQARRNEPIEGTDDASGSGLASAAFGQERSPIPLYHRLYVILRERIVNGTYRAGQVLPTELELMKSYGVSRITAKRAMDELSAEGLVERVRGRGTTVAKHAEALVGGGPLTAGIEGLLANLSVIGRRTSVEILEFGYVAAPNHVAEELGIAPQTPIQRAIRLRRLDGKPFSHSMTFVLERIGRTYDREEMAAHPLIDLIARAGTEIGHVRQSITATLADTLSAQRLDVSVGSPLLKLRRVFFDTEGEPIDYNEILYPPDRFEYRMTLTRGADNKFKLDPSERGQGGA